MAGNFLVDTVSATIDEASHAIAMEYVKSQLAKNGVVSIDEGEMIFDIAKTILESGAEDLVPDNIELPEEDGDLGGDLDVAELEGIILPDAEGNEYVIEGGILVPYNSGEEGDTQVDPTLDPSVAQESNPSAVQESETGVAPDEAQNVSEITESSSFNSTGDILSKIISQVKMK